jgi:hypothetical protein
MRKLAAPIGIALVLLSACSSSSGEPRSGPGLALVLAQDRSAQSVLRNGLVTAKVYFTGGNTFSGFDPSIASGIEPSLTWREDQRAVLGGLSINLVSDEQVVLSTLSESGNAFCVTSDVDAGSTYGRTDAVGATSVADCRGTADGWSSDASAG